jgi:hypothetical protein
MKKLMFLLSLVVLCSNCFAQNTAHHSISLGAGYGLDYGGLGAKISIALTKTNSAAIAGGLGNYFGPPLAFGGMLESKSENTAAATFASNNLTGLGYSVGIEYAYYSEWARGGVHYIRTGKFDWVDGEKSLHGLNWCLFGGNYYFDNTPLFIHYGVNWAFLAYPNSNAIGMMFGASVGIGYSFDFSRSEKKVQTKHLRN